MADLYVSSAVLQSLRSRLSSVSSRMERACGELRHADPQCVGAHELIGAMQDFTDGWDYGIGQIGRCADAAVQSLNTIGQAFDRCDSQLAKALSEAARRTSDR